MQEFADSLTQADHVYLCDIFGSAREETGQLTIDDLQKLINQSSILKLSHTEELKEFADSVLIFMGAGDIQKFQQAYEETRCNQIVTCSS